MRVEVNITIEDLIRFFAHQTKQAMPVRRSLVAYAVTALCVLAGGAFVFAAITDQESWLGAIVIGVSLGLYFIWHVWYWKTYPERTAKTLLARGYGRTLTGRHIVEILEEGVRHSGAFGDSTVRWGAIEKIEEDPDGAFIYVGPSAAIIVPRRSFSDDQTYQQFVDTARAHREAAPSFEASCPECGYDLTALSAGGCPECGWKREVAPEQSPPSPS